jgi:hypothetical protein
MQKNCSHLGGCELWGNVWRGRLDLQGIEVPTDEGLFGAAQRPLLLRRARGGFLGRFGLTNSLDVLEAGSMLLTDAFLGRLHAGHVTAAVYGNYKRGFFDYGLLDGRFPTGTPRAVGNEGEFLDGDFAHGVYMLFGRLEHLEVSCWHSPNSFIL